MSDILANVSEHRELDDTENVGYDLKDHNIIRLALGMMQDYVRHLANGTNNPGITQETAQQIIGRAQDIKDDGVDLGHITKDWLLNSLRQDHLNLGGSSMADIVDSLPELIKTTEKYLPNVSDDMCIAFNAFSSIDNPTVGDADKMLSAMMTYVKKDC